MTTVLSPMEFEHLVQVVRHHACGYRAECWCGWASTWAEDYATADEAGNVHRGATAARATGLDAALCPLLELQDDLADAVMWLAEHWSSQLPVPEAHPGAEQLENGDCVPCLSLLVHCDSAVECVELAELLAAPVVVDLEPDRTGHRHERATRCFGRVRIEAYADVGETAAPDSR